MAPICKEPLYNHRSVCTSPYNIRIKRKSLRVVQIFVIVAALVKDRQRYGKKRPSEKRHEKTDKVSARKDRQSNGTKRPSKIRQEKTVRVTARKDRQSIGRRSLIIESETTMTRVQITGVPTTPGMPADQITGVPSNRPSGPI